MLVDLETPQILLGYRMGRTAQKGSEAPDMADVITLRVQTPRIIMSCVMR